MMNQLFSAYCFALINQSSHRFSKREQATRIPETISMDLDDVAERVIDEPASVSLSAPPPVVTLFWETGPI